jgi:hypothetical protein
MVKAMPLRQKQSVTLPWEGFYAHNPFASNGCDSLPGVLLEARKPAVQRAGQERAQNEPPELLLEDGPQLNLNSSAQSKPRETVGRRATGLSKSREPAEPPEEKFWRLFLWLRRPLEKRTYDE